MHDLSKILCELNRGLEAAKMLEDMIPIVIRTLGEEHVRITMTKGNITKVSRLFNRSIVMTDTKSATAKRARN